MWLANLIRDQFASPSGAIGSLVVVPFLNFTNERLIRASVEALDLKERDRVLDIGFGGGLSLVALANKTPRGRVVGLDLSPDMVREASRLVRMQGLQRRVRVQQGSVEDLPFTPHSFDNVLSVNTIYYWPDLSASLREIARVLKPGGRLALGFHSPASLWLFTTGWDNFMRYKAEEVVAAMRRNGFRTAWLAHRNLLRMPDELVVIGERGLTADCCRVQHKSAVRH